MPCVLHRLYPRSRSRASRTRATTTSRGCGTASRGPSSHGFRSRSPRVFSSVLQSEWPTSWVRSLAEFGERFGCCVTNEVLRLGLETRREGLDGPATASAEHPRCLTAHEALGVFEQDPTQWPDGRSPD